MAGTFLVRNGEIDLARLLLHHADYTYLLEVYVAAGDRRGVAGVTSRLRGKG